MDTLKNSQNQRLDKGIRKSLLGRDVIKVAKRLLGGKYHYQTIGTAVKTVEMEVFADDAMCELLLDAEATLEPVTLVKDGKTYTGQIKETPLIEEYVLAAPHLYIASFLITVEGGSV